MQVQHLCETPIILFGEIWTSLLLWLETEVLPRHLFDRHEMHSIFHVMEPSAVVDLIVKIHKARSETEHVCRNFNKYRLDIAGQAGKA